MPGGEHLGNGGGESQLGDPVFQVDLRARVPHRGDAQLGRFAGAGKMGLRRGELDFDARRLYNVGDEKVGEDLPAVLTAFPGGDWPATGRELFHRRTDGVTGLSPE
ncbi:hypothetical protein [Candidatus Frankia alpina]|uniref:hypothetical protein n=1 Tax=Candidatus Frankia alpina TaxID=2699483 RepID=UPI0013D7A2D6|nr:hypothetical protein [Candidatus Frankia alpina]